MKQELRKDNRKQRIGKWKGGIKQKSKIGNRKQGMERMNCKLEDIKQKIEDRT